MTISQPPGAPPAPPPKPPAASPGVGGNFAQAQQIQAKLMTIVQGIPGATNPQGGIDEIN